MWLFLYLSNSLLLMYRKATDFCILILYPANLPNSLMSSNCFLVEFLRFSCIESCHLQTATVLILHFQFVSFLHLFFLWLLWLGLSKLYWIRVMWVRILAFLNLEEKFSGFTMEYDVNCGIIIYGLYYVRVVPSLPAFWRLFNINKCWILSKPFF